MSCKILTCSNDGNMPNIKCSLRKENGNHDCPVQMSVKRRTRRVWGRKTDNELKADMETQSNSKKA